MSAFMLPLAAVSDEALAVIVGAASLLGAAIGGAITGYVTLRAERKRQEFSREMEGRRDERARQMEDRRDERADARDRDEARAAALLVMNELTEVNGNLETGLKMDRFFVEQTFSQAAWNAHAQTLARTLRPEDYLDVSLAYSGISIVGILFADLASEGEDFAILTGEDAIENAEKLRSLVTGVIEAIGKANEILLHHSYDPRLRHDPEKLARLDKRAREHNKRSAP